MLVPLTRQRKISKLPGSDYLLVVMFSKKNVCEISMETVFEISIELVFTLSKKCWIFLVY